MDYKKGKQIAAAVLAAVLAGAFPAGSAGAALQQVQAEEALPFTIQETDYGVKNSAVKACKLTITDEDVYVVREEEFSGYGYILLEKSGEGGAMTFYLASAKGLAAVLESPDGSYPSITGIAGARENGYLEDGRQIEPRHLYQVENPATGKYNIYNGITGEYFSYEADRIWLLDNGEEPVLGMEKDGKTGLLSGQTGELLYQPVYEDVEILCYVNGYGSGQLLGSLGGKSTLLTHNGLAPGDTFYQSLSWSESEGKYCIASEEDQEGYQVYRVLSGKDGRLLSEAAYQEVRSSSQGIVGERWISDETPTVDIITEEGTRNLGEYWRLGNDSYGQVFMDGNFLATYDPPEGSIEVWFLNMEGQKIMQLDPAGWADTAYEGWYCGMVEAVDRDTGVHSLRDTRGNILFDQVASPEQWGNYVLAEDAASGNTRIISGETKEVVLELEGTVRGQKFVDSAGTGLLLKNEEEAYGIFDTFSGDFSGFLCVSDNSRVSSEILGRYEEGRAVWYIPDTPEGDCFFNEKFQPICVCGWTGGDSYTSEAGFIDQELNITFGDLDESGEKMIRVVDYEGNTLAEITDPVSPYRYYFDGFRMGYGYQETGMISKKGAAVLEPVYAAVSDAWYGLALGSGDSGGQSRLVDMQGNVLAEGEAVLPDPSGETANLGDGSIALLADGDTVYFYDFLNAALEGIAPESIRLTSSSPAAGETQVSSSRQDIVLNFNQEVALGTQGTISLCEYETDQAVLNYSTGSGSVVYGDDSHTSIRLQNALEELEPEKTYYLLMDGQCLQRVSPDPEKEGEWFPGISGKEELFFTMDKVFTLGRDNNSFNHGDSFPDGYTITDAHYQELLIGLLGKGAYEDFSDSSWGGSCYGISSSMALNMLGLLDYKGELYQGDYYDLDPLSDQSVRNIINYYHMTQMAGSLSVKSYRAPKDAQDQEGIAEVLSGFVEAVQEKQDREVILFEYGYAREGKNEYRGHMIFAVDVSLVNEEYQVTLYDMNSVEYKNEPGDYLTMYISPDYRQFHFQDANGNIVGNDGSETTRLLAMDYFYPESLYSAYSPGTVTESRASAEPADHFICFTAGESAELENSSGESLSLLDGISGTLDPEELDFIVQDTEDGQGGLLCRLPAEPEESYTLRGLGENAQAMVKTGGQYAGVKGSNLESIQTGTDGSLRISGQDLQCQVTMSDETVSDPALTLTLSAEEDVVLKRTEGSALQLSSQGIIQVTEIKTTEADGTTSVEQVDLSGQELEVGGELPFTDVAPEAWYYPYVQFVYRQGVMSGMDAETFAPYGILSRAQFATMLYRLEGEPAVEYDDIFPDVPEDEGLFFVDAAIWAQQTGVVTGYTEGPDAGLFGPSDPITREQIATMLYRYAAYKGYDLTESEAWTEFDDSGQISSWARNAMAWAVHQGIFTGKEDSGLLEPLANINRAETAAVTQRFIETFM